jgi:hypothetical protein
MKACVVILHVLLMQGACFASEVEQRYYVGEAKLSEASGTVYGSQAILLEKSLDPDNNIFVERAIVVKADGMQRSTE